jgi:hypothetical protein
LSVVEALAALPGTRLRLVSTISAVLACLAATVLLALPGSAAAAPVR